ncbi:MAG: GNAT family N-acetyltransferase [Ruminiclostridium sp.]|nr:GNAT family N-acetyltransferase [Ruminiclostridium sp.]
MNTVKKIELEALPQDFSPHTLPEILKLAKKIKGDAALVYECLNKPFFMETDRLIIRRFTVEDAEAVYELSNDRMNSSMKNFDHQWPTDMEGCKGAAAYFASEDIYYAVCLKPSMKLIGLIAYNSVDDIGVLDLGHVWHTVYQNNDLDAEALSLMTQYAFEKLGVNGVCAKNPLDCEEQIAPLKALGMEITDTFTGSLVNDEKGNPIEFTGCVMLITRKQWFPR